jgi:hypothetical protein
VRQLIVIDTIVALVVMLYGIIVGILIWKGSPGREALGSAISRRPHPGRACDGSDSVDLGIKTIWRASRASSEHSVDASKVIGDCGLSLVVSLFRLVAPCSRGVQHAMIVAPYSPNHTMEQTASGYYYLPFDSLNPYPVAMHPLARDTSSWSR